MNRTRICCVVSGLVLAVGARVPATGVSTAFTYQGHLTFSDQPINNVYDMCFSLYDAEAQEPGHAACSVSVGLLAGSIVFNGNGSNPPPVSVADGIFTVLLDFQDASLFDGKALWLEISLKPHGPDPNYILLSPRLLITGTPYAQGLRYPQVAEAELVAPMFQMTQSGEGAAMNLTGRRYPVIITSASPVLDISSEGGGVAACIASEPVSDPMWTPDPTIPTFIAKNRIGGVAGSFTLDPPPTPWMPDTGIPALVASNRATGPAGLFHVGDPNLPIEDGCPPQCPPFPWPWIAAVAPGIDVINQAEGPAARFVTDAIELVPAVHVANEGIGGAIQARSNNESPTFEASNTGTGPVGSFFIPDPGAIPPTCFPLCPPGCGPPCQPRPWQGEDPAVIDVINLADGPAGRFETNATALLPAVHVANRGQGIAIQALSQADDPAVPAVAIANQAGGLAATFHSIPNPDDWDLCPPFCPPIPWPWDVSTPPVVDVINQAGGPAAHFATDASDALLPAIHVANDGLGPAIKAVSNGLCFDGEGDMRITGEFTKNYGNGSPSFHRTGPIAYATINSDGTVAAGTPNVSSVWNLVAQRYEITIDDESYSTAAYVTTVTPIAIAPADALFANTSAGGSGDLRVRIMSPTSGTTGLQKPFHFVVYKP